jgi:hypothetical protein
VPLPELLRLRLLVLPLGYTASRTGLIKIDYFASTLYASSHFLISLSTLFARLLWCFRKGKAPEAPEQPGE